MGFFILEICAFSLDACTKAELAGANRIELCAGPNEGGTTPAYSLIKKACEILSIPIVPIIRPRGGNFNYSPDEFEMMIEDVKMSKKLGCFGVALGVLNRDNTVDKERMKKLIQAAAPMQVTFIRAFDLTPDPFEALNDLIDVGCNRVLTSGQQLKAENGTNLLKELIQKAGDAISIMPGSGINPSNLNILMESTGAFEFHASARSVSSNEQLNEFGFGHSVSCHFEAIKQMRNLIDDFTQNNTRD